MLCAISGVAPEEPVVSKKSGAVFEKRLIEKYIQENGKDPVSGEELDVEDLLPIKTARTVTPRPPTLTSIPALLSQFQNEWDSLAIETYNLREQLARTREELATALYQHDAAVRVIARLTKERDEARSALSSLSVSSSNQQPDAMAIDTDTTALPDYLVKIIDETHARLSKGRKKRTIPEGWAGKADMAGFEEINRLKTTEFKNSAMAVGPRFTVVGDEKGEVSVYANDTSDVLYHFNLGSPVTILSVAPGDSPEEDKILVGTSSGATQVHTIKGPLHAIEKHNGAVVGLASHPSGGFFASVSSGGSISYYDEAQLVFRKNTDYAMSSCEFHPDGHLVAAGTRQGQVILLDTKTGDQMASVDLGPPVSSLAFSENGYFLAAASASQTDVTIFDLRKLGDAALKTLTTSGPVRSLAFDYSGQFLAYGGPQGAGVYYYAKTTKSWGDASSVQAGVPATIVGWGDQARSLRVLAEQEIVVLGVQE